MATKQVKFGDVKVGETFTFRDDVYSKVNATEALMVGNEILGESQFGAALLVTVVVPEKKAAAKPAAKKTAKK